MQFPGIKIEKIGNGIQEEYGSQKRRDEVVYLKTSTGARLKGQGGADPPDDAARRSVRLILPDGNDLRRNEARPAVLQKDPR